MGALFSSRPRSSSVAHRYYNSFVGTLPSQKGKFFAITGTSSGIGLEAARAVVRSGGNVLCLNRPSERASASLDALKAECVEGATATGVACDLQNFDSVRSAAAAVRQHVEGTGLYALLNNAGCMGLPETATKDGFDVQMQTNHLSHFLLTSLLLPSLEKSVNVCGDARVVNQTGAARNMDGKQTLGLYTLEAKFMQPLRSSEPDSDNPADGQSEPTSEEEGLGGDSESAAFKRYQQTKLANIVFTLSLADRLKSRGSKVKALVTHPGICETAFHPQPGHNVGFFGRTLMSLMKRFISQSCGDGAMPIVAAAVNTDAKSGDFYGPSVLGLIGKMLEEPMTGPPQKVDWEAVQEKEAAALDPKGHQLLWECSEEAIGQDFFV